MEDLQLLIKSLNKSEKKMVKNFLTNYGNNGEKDTMSLKLFNVLNNRSKHISNKNAAIILFGNDQKNRIRVLKSRMKNKILDALTTEIVLENQKYDVSIITSILLKKKLTQFETLFHSKRANIKLLSDLLDNVIEKATEYELYRILIEALNLKKQILGFRKGIKEYESIEKKEQEAIEFHKGLTTVINHYYKILLLYRDGNTSQQKLLKYISKSIKEGEEMLKISKSKNVEHYLNIIKYAYYDEERNYVGAQKIMLKEVQLLKSSKAVFRLGRLGASYDYLCETNLRMGDYFEAEKSAKEGQKCFNPQSLNYTVARGLEFRALLHQGNLKEANKIIKSICHEYQDSIDSHRISTYQFFLANFYFLNGNYRKCNRVLQEKFEFKADKTGWEFNARILDMMTAIEQGKTDMAYNNHNSLVRYFNRNKEEKKLLSSRNKIILKLIGQWLKHSGNKTAANMKESELLAKLSLPKNEWDPLGSELIPFHKWLEGKV